MMITKPGRGKRPKPGNFCRCCCGAAGLPRLRTTLDKMIGLLLSEGSTTKAKEAGNFAFCITDAVIPDGMPRVGVVACLLVDAGLYTTGGDLVYGSMTWIGLTRAPNA